MKITLETADTGYAVVGYAPGEITVTGLHEAPGARQSDEGRTTLTRSVLISRTRIRADWPPQSLDELRAEHLQMILEMQPEVVLIGTGHSLRFPEPHLLAPVIRQGLGYEVMDTQAACRTYNILANESRNVVAALLIE